MSEWFENGEKWYPSMWGASDQKGNLNYVTREKTLEAVSLVKTGDTVSLAHEIYNGMPGRQSAHGPFFYLISQRVYDVRPPARPETRNKFGGALSRLEMVDHLGTHLDSLNHISFDNHYYNGLDAYEETTTFGTYHLGIDTTPPIVTKGIMVDISGPERIMEKGRGITVNETERFLEERSIKISNGDAVFFHTGVGSLWHKPDVYNSYFEESPGIGYELSKWIASKGVSISGSDTPASEVSPPEFQGTRLPVHQYLITKSGIRLIDNINLTELSRRKIYEFMFVCTPLRIRGGTASPVNPIAII